MEKKRTYLVLFLVLILAASISFLIIFNGLTSSVTTNTFDSNQVAINDLQQEVNSLKNDLTNSKQKVSTLELNSQNIDQKLARIDANLNSLNAQIAQLEQNTDSKINSISTGLAGLQDEVDVTSTEVNKNSQVGIIAIILFIIFVILAVIAWFYYKKEMTSTKKGKPNSQVLDYITHHIKKGAKYHHIKSNLLQAGWLEKDIESAYKSTIKNNYRSYKNNGKKGVNKKKVAVLSVVTVVVLFSAIFLIRGVSSGQAYQFYGGVADYEEGTGLNRVLSEKQCFPPRIMINGQCCDDRDSNNVCDDQEGYSEEDTSSQTGLIIIE